MRQFAELDVPLSDWYNSEHLDPLGTAVVKIRPRPRVSRSEALGNIGYAEILG